MSRLIYKDYIEKENKVFKIVSYYNRNEKNIWFSVIPVQITKKDGYQIESFEAMSGLKSTIIKDISRISNKIIENAISIIKANCEKMIDTIILNQKQKENDKS